MACNINTHFIHFRKILPEKPCREELVSEWTLRDEDFPFLQALKRDNTKQFAAIQILSIRRTGTWLRNESKVSPEIVVWVNQQLGITLELPWSPPEREHTTADLKNSLLKYIGWSEFDNISKQALSDWIKYQAKFGKARSEILSEAKEKVFESKTIFPGMGEFEKFIGSEFHHAEIEIINNICEIIPEKLRSEFENILKIPPEKKNSFFEDLKEQPPDAKSENIIRWLEQEKYLANLGIKEISFKNILSNKLFNNFAYSAEKYTAYEMNNRLSKENRDAILTCFLVQRYSRILDTLVEMHDKFIMRMKSKAKRAYEKKYAQMANKLRAARRRITKAAWVLVENDDEKLVEERNKLDIEALRGALEAQKDFERLEDKGGTDELINRAKELKKYFPQFLQIEFGYIDGEDNLKSAIEYAIYLSQLKTKPAYISSDIFHNFMTQEILSIAINKDGEIRRILWEISLAEEIKKALNARRLYLKWSKRHTDIFDILKEAEKSDIFQKRSSCDEVIESLKKEFTDGFNKFSESLPNNSFVYFERTKKELKFKTIPKKCKRNEDILPRHVVPRALRKIRIEEIVYEIDKVTGFSNCFKHHSTGESIADDRKHVLYAVLISQATNLGFTGMANATENITVDEMVSVAQNYVSNDNLKAANIILVNYQNKLPYSEKWVIGNISSSDGERVRIRGDALIANFYPRDFGQLVKGVSIYTHMSTKFSVFYTQVIACGIRESLYVLTGLLEHDTDLPLNIHTTDTHGYMDDVFALSWLLGFTLAPRIKDLSSCQLWKISEFPSSQYDAIFSGNINFGIIKEQWDKIQGFVAALKGKLINPPDLIKMLVAGGDSNPLSKAFEELGKLVKTIFLFRYFYDEEFRLIIRRQLDRAESRHNLARNISFFQRGEYRTGSIDELINKASSLSFMCNIFVTWNTIELAKAVDNLRNKGIDVPESELEFISPLLHEHIIRTGTYSFRKFYERGFQA